MSGWFKNRMCTQSTWTKHKSQTLDVHQIPARSRILCAASTAIGVGAGIGDNGGESVSVLCQCDGFPAIVGHEVIPVLIRGIVECDEIVADRVEMEGMWTVIRCV